MTRNLIISGGIFHPFDETSQALADILEGLGVQSEVTEDVDAAVAKLVSGNYRMLTVNALRWGMMTADKYRPYRARWAYRMPLSTGARLTGFVKAGGALLGMHTASICFDDWPEWGDVLGGTWQWGESHHPPPARVRATPTRKRHALTQGVNPFDVEDEVYHGLKLEADIEPLVVAECAGGEGPQPVVWARACGKGRVVYDALGHDAASINQPDHRRLLQNAARWLLGDDGSQEAAGRLRGQK